jgi:RNA polymerase sigma-70 factor (sigma-E family)
VVPGTSRLRRTSTRAMTSTTTPVAPPPATEDVEPPRTATSFEALFAREYGPMVRLAFLLVDTPELAEEVVQDSFVRLHERWEQVSNPGGYLRASVVNRARDVQRRRQRERRLPLRAVESSSLEADLLGDALAGLPAKRRAAIVLRFYEDLSEAEIAEVLGVRPGTVKSLIHRGLHQLREVIER